ncbi:TetR/AcrR family transcriptional regulator [Tolypothrix campylonemoides VB511288]|nr:TetR/AcrR family transcriptional regulator [Tolypothrix campylonemoides VB511288]
MPKIVDHDQYRKELLSKCFYLFAEKGYASITMREIAQGIGISTGTLYHYFPTKEALFDQLVEEVSQHTVRTAMTELDGARTQQELMEALGRFLDENADSIIKETFIFIDFCRHHGVEAFHNNPAIKRARERYGQVSSELFGILDPELIQFSDNLLSGIILNHLLGHKSISFTEQVSLLGKMLTAYLEKRVGKSDLTLI